MNENLDPVLQPSEEMVNEDMHSELVAETSLSGHQALTKEEIIEKIKNLLNEKDVPSRADIDALKQAFYKLRSQEVEALKNKFVEDGGDPKDFVGKLDPAEEEIKILLNSIKDKRSRILAEEEKVKEDNLSKKLHIIESIKNLTESSDDFNKLYKEFKDLQQAWNEIKEVPQAKVNELWKSYQLHAEKFYDLIKINNEFRDYDFRKNLDLKTSICEAVEKLEEETDIISSFHQLQNFHQQWRDIGPVAKELREEIWGRFKNASTLINKKYQDHFEQLKASEETNLVAKKAICEELQKIDYSKLVSFKDWDEKSKEVIELQAKWKTIGFVPRKVNSQIFDEFRALCDKFFESKAAFFKVQKDGMEDNLRKKRELFERANALKNSTDWRKTTDELIAIQKEWKTVGPVPRKYSDSLWKDFVAACDYFFEQKNKNNSSQKDTELANLALKKDVIAKITNLDQSMESKKMMDELRSYMDEWHAIGFVPFKEKDKIYKEYQAALDVHFDRLKVDKSERRLQSFKSNLEDISKSERPKGRLMSERERLVYQFNKVKSDLQTYENNIGFLSISKGASSLLKDMDRKIEDLKNEMELIVKKIDAIDASMDASN